VSPNPSDRVLIVSDDERVAALVEMAVRPALKPEIVVADGKRKVQPAAGNYGLIILALSAFDSEPIVALARASLTLEIGHVPLLIISDRSFRSDPSTHIRHMGFPFTVGELFSEIQTIMRQECAPASA
jgi:DNA-binding response OmpR family regulator